MQLMRRDNFKRHLQRNHEGYQLNKGKDVVEGEDYQFLQEDLDKSSLNLNKESRVEKR